MSIFAFVIAIIVNAFQPAVSVERPMRAVFRPHFYQAENAPPVNMVKSEPIVVADQLSTWK